MTPGALRLATRSSPLALLQTSLVADAVRAAHPGLIVEIVATDTIGDRTTDRPLDEIEGRGIFTNEVDALVASGRADAAVHSAKDLPSSEGPGAPVIAAVLARGEVRDALVGARFDELVAGAPVATGAPRRRAQLAALRPDLGFVPLRGNIATRLSKVPEGGAAVVALAALERLGIADHAVQILSIRECLPQVGQGVIAIRCAEGDDSVIELLSAIDDTVTHRALDAERSFLAQLGGGCDAPVGAFAVVAGDGAITLEAMIAAGDGHTVLRRSHVGSNPTEVGRTLAEEMVELDGASTLTADSW